MCETETQWGPLKSLSCPKFQSSKILFIVSQCSSLWITEVVSQNTSGLLDIHSLLVPCLSLLIFLSFALVFRNLLNNSRMDLLPRSLNSHQWLLHFVSAICKKLPSCATILLISRPSTHLITNNCAFCQNALCRTSSTVSLSQQFSGKNHFVKSSALRWRLGRILPSFGVLLFCSRLAMVISSIVSGL